MRKFVFLSGLSLVLAACSGPADEAESNSDSSDQAAAQASEDAPTTGTIAGKLTYPSTYIPKDIQVCAEETTSEEVTCKGGFEGDSYEMELAPGTYHVYSRTDDMEGYRAYYSKAVPCGLSVDCTDHSPLDVDLAGGEALSDIDPGDWYAQQ